MRLLAIIVLMVSAVPRAVAAETPADRQFQSLLDQYEQEGGRRTFAKRFLELAEQHPQDSAAADALLWVVEHVRGKPDTTQALELLAEHHVRSAALGAACKSIADSRSIAAEKLLRAVLADNPNDDVRARACFQLASRLDREASIVQQLKAQPELAPRVLQYYGKEYGEHLASLDVGALTKKRERVYERMRESFADAKVQDTTMGKIAEKALFAIRHLSIGRQAPEIEGEDIHGEEFKLSDYRGKVVMLTFWGHW